MAEIKVKLGDWVLDNPVIAASGCFGYGKEFAELYDINILGSFAFKGTTAESRFGNPTPRIAEIPSGILNSVGLQNPGARYVAERELPEIKKFFNKKIIANISGFSVAEFVECAEIFDNEPQVGIIEVNISCPNVHNGGISCGSDPKSAAAVCAAVKKIAKKPVYIKLSPNVTDIAEIARACEAEGADGLSLINTPIGVRIDLNRKKPLLANITGGMSGPAIFPLAVRMVWQAYEAVKIPIIGIGGVSSADDVLEMMLAGASAVQVGAANLINPFACKEIIGALPGAAEKYGIEELSGITGAAHII